MKKHLLALFFFISICTFSTAQVIQEYELMQSYTIEDLENLRDEWGVPEAALSVDYPINLYKVIYSTPDAKGENMTIASGAIAFPVGAECGIPIGSYSHGTTTHKDGVPSRYSSEVNIGLLFGATGYAVAMADLLGLGDSPGLHPYIHAKSEATATIDMLRATRELADQEGVRLNGQLFLFGYSQGGHTSMATHRELQLFHANEFTVTASNPMSGPYDVAGVQADVITSDEPYPTPSYLPYVLLAYNQVYDFFDDASVAFKPPYNVTLPPLFDGTHGNGEIHDAMPDIPKEVLDEDLLNDYINDPDHFFRVALRDNDLYDWVPETPVKMTYCESDDQVTYLNSIVAYDAFIAAGADPEIVTKVSGGASNDHNGCVSPALLIGKSFFDGLKDFSNFIATEEVITPESEGNDGAIDLNATGGIGDLSYEWSNGETTASISGLSSGTYSVTIMDDTGCGYIEEFEVVALVNTNELDEALHLNLYPNPTSADVAIQLPDTNQSFDLMVRDLTGKLVFSTTKITGNIYTLNSELLNSGVYLIELKGENTYFGKVVKH